MRARPLFRLPLSISIAAACAAALVLGLVHLTGQAQGAALQVLSRDSRRLIPIVAQGSQEMLPLDELASAFQLAVRDDGGAITVAYKGRSVVLTPDQTIASVAGRLISLPAPPSRSGNRWLVPIDFVSRALAPIYDSRLELRRASRLLLVGDVRVPRVSMTSELLSGSARLTIDIAPTATSAVTQQGPRLLVRLDADALDLAIPALQPNPFVQAVRTVDQTSLAIELGPRFASYRSAVQPIDNGSRLVIDVVGAVTEAAPTPAPAPAINSPNAPIAGDVLPRDIPIGPGAVRTVAIDAGHGGTDAGARGPAGTLEKDVTLAVARRLRGAIEGRLGLRVVMTRDEDREVPLSERTAIANNNKADLFISLHANASFRREVSGATVYIASFADADIAQEGIPSERMPVSGGGQRVLEIIPWSLAQIPHRERSEQLAGIVANTLASRVPLTARPIDRAPLRVLESANMPAVLVEIGYLTNVDQEKAIAASELQAAVAQALVDAIVRFRDRAVFEGGAR